MVKGQSYNVTLFGGRIREFRHVDSIDMHPSGALLVFEDGINTVSFGPQAWMSLTLVTEVDEGYGG